MIKFETKLGSVWQLEIKGTITDITADALIAIRAIYDALHEDSEEAAEMFATGIKHMIRTNPSVFAVWDRGNEDE